MGTVVTRNGTVSLMNGRENYLENLTSASLGLTETDITVMGWILTVGSFLIISTNLLVAVALVLLIHKRGSQNWCFVLNLSVADILVGLAITGIANDMVKGRLSSTHKEACLLRMAFVIAPSAASILTMFLISVDRYAAIKLPLRYQQLMDRRVIASALACLWLLSTVVGFLPSVVEEMQDGRYGSVCTLFSVIDPQSIIVVFCVTFFPVLSVFIYCYLDILKIACGHQRRILQTAQASSRCVPASHYWGHVKALRTVAVLVGCFTLCWCPFFVVSVVQVLCQPCELYRFLEYHLWLLGLSNSLINPLVYAFWQKEVRQQLCCMFARIKANHCCMKVSERSHTDHTAATQTRNPFEQALHCSFVFWKPATMPQAAPNF
ncbi:glucose-dependent insulinotropic receptor [Brachyhypopomus gauderio]|uniref:glucose-dependent insulinotropic receptor n=1 Tax=Brachyhypopomus gauderio TaxID=698409 RepID=UPI004042C33F